MTQEFSVFVTASTFMALAHTCSLGQPSNGFAVKVSKGDMAVPPETGAVAFPVMQENKCRCTVGSVTLLGTGDPVPAWEVSTGGEHQTPRGPSPRCLHSCVPLTLGWDLFFLHYPFAAALK